jgi:electron transport complex protein RnfG
MLFRHMVTTGAFLGLFAVIGTGMVAMTFMNTESVIAANEREALLESLHELVPPRLHDNELDEATLVLKDAELLGSKKPVTAYQARKFGHPVAVILTATAPDGYNGNIKLLIAIDEYGLLLGVRVINHHETPGLGDAIDKDRSDWIDNFNGYSLDNPGNLGWHVEKDGGIFDQFTGATITPRAVVKAVHKALQYFESHKDVLLTPPAKEDSEEQEAENHEH